METTRFDHQPTSRYVATEHAPPRVVLADDEPDILKLVACALRGFGFDIAQARNGVELMDKVFAEPIIAGTPRPPDIVVTDVRMPGLTGLDILAAMRRANLRTAVVLMTAHPDDETRAQASKLGADAFIAKPFDVDELVTTVVNLTPTPTGCRE